MRLLLPLALAALLAVPSLSADFAVGLFPGLSGTSNKNSGEFAAPLWSLSGPSGASFPSGFNSKAEDKIVLYLVDAPDAAWFYLGAFYAFETYGVPVDSVVGSSVGAWMASLWQAGWSLDEIQLLLLDSAVAPFLSEAGEPEPSGFSLPLADAGKAAIRAVVSVSADSTGLKFSSEPLEPDREKLALMRFRLRVEESLYRQPLKQHVSVLTCSGEVRHGAEAVLRTMPFPENSTGAGCAIPLPGEASVPEHPVILTALPYRLPPDASPEFTKLYLAAGREFPFYKEAATFLRPHSLDGQSKKAIIQSGFSEVENRLAEISAVRTLAPYETPRQEASSQKLVLLLDSVPSELHGHLRSFWNDSDSGLASADNFMEGVLSYPVYDSLGVKMRPEGSLLVRASSPFVLDVRAGGFGSNALGGFVFGDLKFRYVNQFEYAFGAEAFYGMGGYGIAPEFKISRLLEGTFDFAIRYDLFKLRPLKGYFSDNSYRTKILEEFRRDFWITLDFCMDSSRTVTFSMLVGSREYSMSDRLTDDDIEATPLEPKLEFRQATPNYSKWFGERGYSFGGAVGMESVGTSFGSGETVPIFFKGSVSGDASLALSDFATLGGGLAGGASFTDEMEYPEAFGYDPIDLTIRQGIEATPWSTEWYFAEYRSHHYALARAHFGLHYGPFGAWLFGAFIRDFENNVLANLGESRLVLEPALRFAHKSLSFYAGMNRTLSAGDWRDFSKISDYTYFVRVGTYQF